MNEENGTKGGRKYAAVAKEKNENHILAIESDAGGFTPRGFGFTGSATQLEKLRSYLPYFNQNTMVQRSVQNNMIIDDQTTIISRYFLLKMTYKFNNNKTKVKDASFH